MNRTIFRVLIFLSMFFICSSAYGAYFTFGPTSSLIRDGNTDTSNRDYLNGSGSGIKFQLSFHIEPTLFLVNFAFGISNFVLSEGNNDNYLMEYGETGITMKVFTMHITFGIGQALINDNDYLPDSCGYNFISVILPLTYGKKYTLHAEPFYKNYYGSFGNSISSFYESGIILNFNINF